MNENTSFAGRISSIEQFCSSNLLSSLSLELDDKNDEKQPAAEIVEEEEEEEEEEEQFRPRAASVVNKQSPMAYLRVPKLNIAILVCGTRGDVQPFVIIGLLLKSHGHRVRLATHDLYEDYVIDSGLEFYPLAGDPKKLSAHMVETGGRLLPLTAEEVKAVPEKQQMLEDIMRSTFPACTRAYHNPKSGKSLPFRAEAIISNPVTYGHLHVAEYLDVPLHLMFPQPWSPTSGYPHPLSSVHDQRFYFAPTASSKKKKNKKESHDMKHELKRKEQLREQMKQLGEVGPGNHQINEEMTAADYALFYDVRLTNRLSYKVADEFVWMGLRRMTNDFRVDLQTRLRVELKLALKNIHKKAGCSHITSNHGMDCLSNHSSSSPSLHGSESMSATLPHTRSASSISSRSSFMGTSSHGSSTHHPTSGGGGGSGGGEWVGMEKIRAGESGANIIHDLKIPFAKMWSAALIPTPNDYGSHIDIIGNVFAPLQDTASYQPPPGLLEWLKVEKDGQPDPPIFVGFGSMIIKDTASLISTIEKAAELSGRRVLLQSSWTDLSKAKKKPKKPSSEPSEQTMSQTSLKSNDKNSVSADGVVSVETANDQEKQANTDTGSDGGGGGGGGENLNELDEEEEPLSEKVLFHIGGCPHEWLFPYVAAVVHHGGAGTVAAGLRAGKPTIVCPFFGDQFFWGVALERAKVGMNLGSVSKLTPQKLADGFLKLSSPEMAERAQQMARAFEAENGAVNAVESFYRHLPLDSMVCDVTIWKTPNAPSIAKYLVHLGSPTHKPAKNAALNTPCSIHVSEAVFEAICRRFRNNSNQLDELEDVPEEERGVVSVVVPAGLVAGNSFIFNPQNREMKVTVPKGLRGGDTLRVRLPPPPPLPKAHPQPGEWQCSQCTALNNPVAVAVGCAFCSTEPPQGDSLIKACAGATGVRRLEGVEVAVRLSESQEQKEQLKPKTLTRASDDGQIPEASVEEYEDSEDELEEGPRQRAWTAVGMDLVDPTLDVTVYRDACAWIPPTPKDVTDGLYQGTLGFVAKTSQAIGDLVVGDLTASSNKFKKALTTLATKPMQGLKGREEHKRQPRERIMGDDSSDAQILIKKNNKKQKSLLNEDDEEEDDVDIDDDHDDGEDEDEFDASSRLSKGGTTGGDEALWQCFDAAASLSLCWGRHIGHGVMVNETHRMALSELLTELGYKACDAARVEADAQYQWDAGFEVSIQEVAVFLATQCGAPPAALAITMRHAAERHMNPDKVSSSMFSFTS